MSTCGNCGAQNEPAAVRCAYCDSPLAATSSIQVGWLARTPEGVQGEGQIELLAGGGVTTAQVRSAAESAFQGAVRELGPQAKGADVQARMVQSLPQLLPSGVDIRDLSMTAYRRGGAPQPAGARPAGRPPRSAVMIPLIGLLGGMCCLGMGLIMIIVGESAGKRIKVVTAAPIVANLAEAKDGPVCLEGVAARGAEAPVVVTLDSGETARCLYVYGSSTAHSGSNSTRRSSSKGSSSTYHKHADRFSLTDGTRVRVAASTHWSGKLEELGTAKIDGRTLELKGVRVDAPVLTLVGTAHGAELTVVEVSTTATRDGLVADLTERRMVGDAMGFVCVGTGGLLLLVCVGLLLRKRR